MSGRGWSGKNSGSSLTYEQLQNMGVGRGEGPGPTLAPPPLYPKLENPPLPLQIDASMDYMLILKKQFIDHLHDSPAFVQPVMIKNDIERYSDKYKVLSIDGKADKSSFYNWLYVPRELRPVQERKNNLSRGIKRKCSKQVDVVSRLIKLEEQEKNEDNDDTNNDSVAVDKDSSDEEEKGSEKEDIEDPDEEMDENTDYLNNYFDNGEAFDEEDDNIDDDPVY